MQRTSTTLGSTQLKRQTRTRSMTLVVTVKKKGKPHDPRRRRRRIQTTRSRNLGAGKNGLNRKHLIVGEKNPKRRPKERTISMNRPLGASNVGKLFRTPMTSNCFFLLYSISSSSRRARNAVIAQGLNNILKWRRLFGDMRSIATWTVIRLGKCRVGYLRRRELEKVSANTRSLPNRDRFDPKS